MLHLIPLHLIPAPLHRLILRIAHGIRRGWWRWRKPALAGCRVLALDAEGRVLLVRHSYGSPKWMAPGGGIASGEDPLAAAARELREETGCELLDARLLEVVDIDLHGAGNRVHLVAGQALGIPQADRREIVEARFFAADALPADLARPLRHVLQRWLTAATTAGDPPA